MPGTDDVVSAALGHLDHGVAPDRGDAAALREHPEAVLAADGGSVHDQFLTLVEDHDDPVGAGRPGARSLREALRLAAEPVQTGDREEPVRVGELCLLPGVPLLPVVGERGQVCGGALNGHVCSFASSGWGAAVA
ncbi:hypothetical protein SAV14893_079440 [Streptomyces avermitilis]|uniref:Uncharacterized protein n=1 Tax=Streptomyces avermitilis TaxID=33903 RepID=A0A4D4M9C1_STRAX|nr:hypothetical protein SAV14893_079440 [Streptomyces avermitilis]